MRDCLVGYSWEIGWRATFGKRLFITYREMISGKELASKAISSHVARMNGSTDVDATPQQEIVRQSQSYGSFSEKAGKSFFRRYSCMVPLVSSLGLLGLGVSTVYLFPIICHYMPLYATICHYMPLHATICHWEATLAVKASMSLSETSWQTGLWWSCDRPSNPVLDFWMLKRNMREIIGQTSATRASHLALERSLKLPAMLEAEAGR